MTYSSASEEWSFAHRQEYDPPHTSYSTAYDTREVPPLPPPIRVEAGSRHGRLEVLHHAVKEALCLLLAHQLRHCAQADMEPPTRCMAHHTGRSATSPETVARMHPRHLVRGGRALLMFFCGGAFLGGTFCTL